MKKKVSNLIIPCFAAIMSLAGCGEHVHTYDMNNWKTNESKHWHPATCEHNVTNSLGDHVDSDSDGKCDVCNYQMHIHTFSDEWSSDATDHWHKATCGHDLKKNKNAHFDNDEDGKCDVCQYQMTPIIHVHTFADSWASNTEQHWHSATCGHDVRDALANHIDSDSDGKCDVCGYVIHVHTFSSEWSSDATNHWHMATCGHDLKDGEAPHVDNNLDGKCDICAYTILHEHTFSDKWSSNATSHWHLATCGHDVKSEEGSHVDSNSDGKCDVCNYQMHVHTFETDWSMNELEHWHSATCGHDVRKDQGSHVDNNLDGKCDVCNYKMSGGPKPIDEYYEPYNLLLEGPDLERELQKMCFDTHTVYYKYSQYYSAASFTSDHISSEAAPSTVKTTKLNEYFYTGKNATGVGTREHVWPCANSANLWVHDSDAGAHYVDGSGYKGGGSDLYHIRPSTSSVNTARGNSKFCDFDDPEFDAIRPEVVEVGDTGPYKLKLQGGETTKTGGYQYANKAEVADSYKGDVARILVYVWIHYAYRGEYYNNKDMIGQLDLCNVLAYGSDLDRVIEKLCEWNKIDPPSETEKLRNNTVQGLQGNRNPFVDYPELMNQVFCYYDD